MWVVYTSIDCCSMSYNGTNAVRNPWGNRVVKTQLEICFLVSLNIPTDMPFWGPEPAPLRIPVSAPVMILI